MDAVTEFLAQRTGLVFTPTRRAEVERGIRRAMQRSSISDVAQYAAEVLSGALSMQDLVSELTIGETYFMREPRHLELVRTELVPQFFERNPNGVLRCWSAGCATGEEIYSLAIVLEQAGVLERAELFGTDICARALERAREGVYGSWSFRSVDRLFRERYFEPVGERWRIAERFRKRVTFRELNLAADGYPWAPYCGFELILCRNVFIYFDASATRRAGERFSNVLSPGGWLITGASDPSLECVASLETWMTDAGPVYLHSSAQTGRERTPEVNALSQSPTPSAAIHAVTAVEVPATVEPATREQPAVASPPATSGEESSEGRCDAERAFEAGQYQRVLDVLPVEPDDVRQWELRTVAIANLHGAKAALQVARRALAQFPLAPPLHHLQLALAIESGDDGVALAAARRLVYLDRELAIGHFLLGGLLDRKGAVPQAIHAYRNALRVCEAQSPDELLPLGNGERAGRLARAAKLRILQLMSGRGYGEREQAHD
jgi:chemotaxis protein methyltransferase CheR